MWIKEVSLSNYARFQKLDGVEFSRNRTAIVGQNNVGKSALLRALSNEFLGNPVKTASYRKSNPGNVISKVEMTANIPGAELFDAINKTPGFSGRIGLPATIDLQNSLRYGKIFINLDIEVFKATVRKAANLKQGANINLSTYNSESFSYPLQAGDTFSEFILKDKFLLKYVSSSVSQNAVIANIISQIVYSNIFWFSAERLNISKSQPHAGATLAPNCANLPAVLDNYPSNTALAKTILALAEGIIPTIRGFAIMPVQGSTEREVFIWPNESGLPDEAVSLADCGSGVGQVLAILTAAVVSDAPRVILIDEPNSFLHPAAAKKLMSTLASFTQHQFIVATHSIEAIRAFDPETVIHLEANGATSKATSYKGSRIRATREIFADLGVNVADVTGADFCVWVEGDTEADVFPVLAERLIPNGGSRIAFPRVGTTGAFNKRQKRSKEEIVSIYENLTNAVVMMPTLLAFLFDSDGRSDSEKADLCKRLPGKIDFLPRYCFENYLLDAQAIAAVLNEKQSFQKETLAAARVQAWWDEHAADPKYWRGEAKPKPTTDETWSKDIDAAKLLADMVEDISNTKEKYQKTVDSVGIAKWLLDRRPEVFKEIADIIERFLPKPSAR